jgi:hypothetical protein
VVELSVRDASRALRGAGVETQASFEDVTFGGLLVSRLAVLGSGAFTGLNTIALVRPRSSRYAAAAVARAVKAPLRGRDVAVLTPEDFILFKALSTRDRDLDDAASALRRSGDMVDVAAVEKEARTLAAEITGSGVLARLASIRERAGPP